MLNPAALPQPARLLYALGASGRHVYAGTVPIAEVVRRRKANRAARRARRNNR